MLSTMYWILLVYGIYSVLLFTIALNTKNLGSAVIFKIIPFVGGIISMLIGLDGLGFIKLSSILLK